MEIYYYGCGNDEAGHYFWRPVKSHYRYGIEKVRNDHGTLAWSPQLGTQPKDFKPIVPWGYSVDGSLQPLIRNDQGGSSYAKQGEAKLHHKDGWTAIAFWDNSVDDRPGSTSTFVMEGEYDFDEALAIAKENFPSIFERYSFEVVNITEISL
jgi:hypothetical protein